MSSQHARTSPRRVALPPPAIVPNSVQPFDSSPGSMQKSSSYSHHSTTPAPTAPAASTSSDTQVKAIEEIICFFFLNLLFFEEIRWMI